MATLFGTPGGNILSVVAESTMTSVNVNVLGMCFTPRTFLLTVARRTYTHFLQTVCAKPEAPVSAPDS